jgi:hypothetical protein
MSQSIVGKGVSAPLRDTIFHRKTQSFQQNRAYYAAKDARVDGDLTAGTGKWAVAALA